MTDSTRALVPPVLALSVEQAGGALGISVNTLRRHVLPHVRTVAVGKTRIAPVIELERWRYLAAHTSTTPDARGSPGELRDPRC